MGYVKRAAPAPSPITVAGAPVLRARAAPVAPEELGGRALKALVARMIDAMRKAPGVGLAAPQLGVPLRVLVMEDQESTMSTLSAEQRALRGRTPLPLTVVVNPTLTLLGDERATFYEGCLSVPGYMALVPRATRVRLSGTDADGRPLELALEGWPARIAQHECDHLDGTLYVDRMLSRTLGANAEVRARWLDAPVDEVLRALGGGQGT